jgi:hypothetical protein
METNLPDALSVLSAMITPAVLISACGSLIMATSSRANRAVDRARDVAALFAALQQAPPERELLDEERRMLFRQLDLTTRRSRLLQRALARLYSALGTFVATSVAIGLVAVSGRQYTWVPVALGLLARGCCCTPACCWCASRAWPWRRWRRRWTSSGARAGTARRRSC